MDKFAHHSFEYFKSVGLLSLPLSEKRGKNGATKKIPGKRTCTRQWRGSRDGRVHSASLASWFRSLSFSKLKSQVRWGQTDDAFGDLSSRGSLATVLGSSLTPRWWTVGGAGAGLTVGAALRRAADLEEKEVTTTTTKTKKKKREEEEDSASGGVKQDKLLLGEGEGGRLASSSSSLTTIPESPTQRRAKQVLASLAAAGAIFAIRTALCCSVS